MYSSSCHLKPSLACAKSDMEYIIGGSVSSLIHIGFLYHVRAGMPPRSIHLQASPYLTLECVANPTNSLCEPLSVIMFQFAWPFLVHLSITLL